MPWAVSVLLLIMVAVIILSNLGRAAQQGQRRTPRSAPPRTEAEKRTGPQARRSPSEVERFLEEVNRRRLEAAEQRRRAGEALDSSRSPARPSSPPPVSRTLVAPPAPPPVPPRPPVLLQERQERAPPPLPSPAPRRPVEREGVIAPAPTREVPAPASAGPATQQRVTDRPHQAAPTVTHWAEAAGAVRLREMLREPQSIRAALMLREVLDPPLALRKRRR